MANRQDVSIIQKLLTVIIDAIFPPGPEEKLLRAVTREKLRTLYRPNDFAKCLYLSDYSEPIVRCAITQNKFYHRALARELLGELLDEWLKRQTSKNLFIPIPLSAKRQKERGHNQVLSILTATKQPVKIVDNWLIRSIDTTPQTELAKTERLLNLKDAFRVNRKTHIALAKSLQIEYEDKTNGAEKFGPGELQGNTLDSAYTYIRRDSAQFSDSNTILPLPGIEQVILFDDVVTTGATLAAARATLAPHLPKEVRLICLAVAH